MADIGKLWTPEHDPDLCHNLTPLKKGEGLTYAWYVWTRPLIHFGVVWEFSSEVRKHAQRRHEPSVLHFTLPFLQAGDGGITGGSGRVTFRAQTTWLALAAVQNCTAHHATGAVLLFDAPTLEPIATITLSGWFLPKDGSADLT